MKCEKPSILIVKQFRKKTGPCLQCSTSIPKGLLHFYQEVQISLQTLCNIPTAMLARKWSKKEKKTVYGMKSLNHEMRAYLGLNIIMGINQLPSNKDYWVKDLFLGN